MKNTKKLLSLLLVIAMIFALAVPAFAEGETPSMAGKTVIVHSNDVHGAIAGYANMAALAAEYESQGAKVIVADAGDFSQGKVEVSSNKGLNAVKMMNAAGYDVATLGNHEFDYGMDRAKAIMKEGNSLWVVPTYTNHPTWDWDKRHEENGYPFGMGLGRQVIDNRGNERSFFLVTFVDSNYRPEPVAGYQWVARWPVAGTGLHVGAGYLAAVSARGDYMWVPFPMPLPVAKIGTDDISFYGTYIPVTNVFFFYSTITIDDAKRRDLPLPATSALAASDPSATSAPSISRASRAALSAPEGVNSLPAVRASVATAHSVCMEKPRR